MAENIANLPEEKIYPNSNLALSRNRDKSPEFPDLILHSGGQVVSKALTGYLRRANCELLAHWQRENLIDTFKLASIVYCFQPIPDLQCTFGMRATRVIPHTGIRG